MKGLVVYDSYYGNTQMVAEAIAQELEAQGHQAELRSVRKKYSSPPQGDVLLLGSPVRLGTTTRRVKKFVEGLDKRVWAGKPLVVFTTVLGLPADATPERVESREKYDLMAGRKLAERGDAQGLKALDEQLWVDVSGLKGPLAEAGLEQTRQFTRALVGPGGPLS